MITGTEELQWESLMGSPRRIRQEDLEAAIFDVAPAKLAELTEAPPKKISNSLLIEH